MKIKEEMSDKSVSKYLHWNSKGYKEIFFTI